MTREVMIGALKQGNTGAEILSILDAITGGSNNAPAGYDYVESPMIESVLGIQPTLEPIEF